MTKRMRLSLLVTGGILALVLALGVTAGLRRAEIASRGWTHLSYTLVVDDNWPSRRTGEGLGAKVCANCLVYRRGVRW